MPRRKNRRRRAKRRRAPNSVGLMGATPVAQPINFTDLLRSALSADKIFEMETQKQRVFDLTGLTRSDFSVTRASPGCRLGPGSREAKQSQMPSASGGLSLGPVPDPPEERKHPESKESSEDWCSSCGAEDLYVSIRAVRSVFKADTPYRCRLGFSGAFATSGSGVVNFSVGPSSLPTVAEWSSISVLFDEIFVHTLVLTYLPTNDLGGGTGAYSTTGGGMATGLLNTGATTSVNLTVANTGLIWVSSFNTTGTYTSADSMLDNPTRMITHSAHRHKYTWRNNVRFDPRGLCIPGATSAGWGLVSNVASFPGNMQCRAIAEQKLGDGAHTVLMGNYALIFDVSFRQRI